MVSYSFYRSFPKCVPFICLTISVKLKDVLIKMGEFTLLIYFVGLETKVAMGLENEIPVILGQPLLATSNALINC